MQADFESNDESFNDASEIEEDEKEEVEEKEESEMDGNSPNKPRSPEKPKKKRNATSPKKKAEPNRDKKKKRKLPVSSKVSENLKTRREKLQQRIINARRFETSQPIAHTISEEGADDEESPQANYDLSASINVLCFYLLFLLWIL